LKLAIASGKGGTGKTLVATSMVLSARDSAGVHLLDCDVEAPNAHLFLNLECYALAPVEIKVPVLSLKSVPTAVGAPKSVPFTPSPVAVRR